MVLYVWRVVEWPALPPWRVVAFGSTALGNVIFHRWLASQDPNPPSSPTFVIPLELVLGALLLAAVISLIGSALPSRRAVRLQPLDALRYE